MPARILAIVLNYNNFGLTLEAVAAARAIDYPDYDLVVVDNGSTDGSAERLRAALPRVELIEHAPNEGISGGFNVGLRLALERGFDIALLISNDVEVAPGIATAVADAFERDASVGVVAPLSYFADFEGRRDVIWAIGGRLPWTRGTGYHVGQMEPDVGQFAEPFEVDYAPGAAWAIRVETLREIGVLGDAIYFAGEDVDFCLRARLAGWRTLAVPSAKIWHHVSASTKDEPSRYVYYYDTRNKLYLIGRYYRRLHGWRGYLAFVNVGRHIVLRIARATMKRDTSSLRNVLRGVLDAVRGRMGQVV